MNLIIPTTVKHLIYLIIHVFHIRLFDVKLPEDDLKKIETCHCINELHVKVYFNSCASVGVNC
jgi:hypothetical protein